MTEVDLTQQTQQTQDIPQTETVQADVQTQSPAADVFGLVKQQFGREIDEDYLKTDWREKASSLEKQWEEISKKAEAYKPVFENPELLKVADLVNSGVPLKNALEALSINPDELPEDELVRGYATRNAGFIKDEKDLNLLLERKFGVGLDLEVLKEEYPEKYFEVLENRSKALADEKAHLQSRRLELTTPVAKETEPVFTPEQVEKFKSELSAQVESFDKLKLIDDYEVPYDKSQLKSLADNIIFSGGVEGLEQDVTVIKGFKASEVLDALYFLNNKNALTSEFVKEVTKAKSVEAIKKADELYNNVGGANQQQPSGAKQARMLSAEETRKLIEKQFN